MNSKALSHCAHGDFSNVLEHLVCFKNAISDAEKKHHLQMIKFSLIKGSSLIKQLEETYAKEKLDSEGIS